MHFRYKFIIFIVIVGIIFLVIWPKVPKVNIQVNYQSRYGNPITGMTLTDISLIAGIDTLYCDKIFLAINSFSPLSFDLRLSRPSMNINLQEKDRDGGSFTERLWFIPVKINGCLKIIDGKITFDNKEVKGINAEVDVSAFGQNIQAQIDRTILNYQGKEMYIAANLLVNPGMITIKEGRFATGDIDAKLSGSIIGDRIKFDVSGESTLRQIIGMNGKVIAEGEMRYEDGLLSADLRGDLIGLFHSDTFPVFINVLSDTIRVICPEIESDPGCVQIQATFLKGRLIHSDVIFNQFQLSKLIPKIDLVVDGELSYEKNKWLGKLSSSSAGLDSINFDLKNDIFNIQIFTRGGFLEASGKKDSLLVGFSRFPVHSILKVFGHKGKGMITGAIKKDNQKVSGELEVMDLSYGLIDIALLAGVIHSIDISQFTGSVEIDGKGIELAGFRVGDLNIDYNEDITIKSGDSVYVQLSRNKKNFVVNKLHVLTQQLVISCLEPFIISFEEGFRIEGIRFYLNDGLVEGNINIAKNIEFDFKGKKINIKPLTQGLKGILSFKAKGRRVDFNIDQLGFQNATIDFLQGSLVLGPDSVTIEGEGNDGEKNIVVFDGILTPKPNIHLSFVHFPLDAFWFLNDYFLFNNCQVNGDISLGQTPSGSVEISGQELLVKAIRTKITELKGKVSMHGDRILLSKVNGKTEHGSVDAWGWLQLTNFKLDTLHLNIDYNKAYISLPSVYGYTNGKGLIDVGNRVLIHGHIDVIEGIYSYDLGGLTGTSKKTEDKVDFNLKIKAEQAMRMKGNLINADFYGKLRLKKQKGELLLSGEFISNRGEMYYLDHILKIDDANVTFINDPEINPLVDIQASMPTRLGYRIILHVTGRLREPMFHFSSDPEGLSEQDILTYLNTGFTWTELQEMGSKDQMSSLVSERLIRLLTFGLSKELKDISGLDYLDIEKSRLTIGKYLRPNLFFSYTHQLGNFSADAFELDYILRPRERIVIEKIDEGKYAVQYKMRIKF